MHTKSLSLFFIIILGVFQISMSAQDDLLDMLEENQEPVTNHTIATFKNTHLVSGNSIETTSNGVLNFTIQHRFGTLNSGWRDLWGLDNSTIRLGFEYGITEDLNIGIGRASYLKTYDAMVKWKFLKQKYGAKNFPFTATVISSIYLNSTEWQDPERTNYFTSRLDYHHALLLARKFGDGFSIQLMPTLVHRNLVSTAKDPNTLYAIGTGASLKISGSTRLNAEYYYLLPNQLDSEELTNSLSLGLDIETGGHVFQLHVTNSKGMTEKFLVGDTTGKWTDGDIYFGFNISRVFNIKKPQIPN
jgi:hypothetical protein